MRYIYCLIKKDNIPACVASASIIMNLSSGIGCKYNKKICFTSMNHLVFSKGSSMDLNLTLPIRVLLSFTAKL